MMHRIGSLHHPQSGAQQAAEPWYCSGSEVNRSSFSLLAGGERDTAFSSTDSSLSYLSKTGAFSIPLSDGHELAR